MNDEFHRVLARWLERDVLPNVIELEHADAYPTEMVEQMREFGLFGATIPTEYGGLGLSTTVYAEIVTQISAVWMSLTGVLNSHLMMAHLIRMFGTDEQRADFLPKLAAGELRGGLALTEPDGGHRPAGDPHDGAPRRRLLRGQRHEDVDHERRARQLPRPAREDRPRSSRRAAAARRCSSRARTSTATPCRASSGSSATRASTPSSCSSTTCTSTRRGCSVASRAAAWRRCSAGSSSAASTSPRAGSASPTPRCRRRCATRTCARRWDGRSVSTRRSS